MMKVDDSLQRLFTEISELRARQRQHEEPLHGGGGGGTSGGMEQRVARLEGSVDRLRDDVGDLRVQLATLSERVNHLPGKGFIVGASVSTITGLIALFVLLQHLGLLH